MSDKKHERPDGMAQIGMLIPVQLRDDLRTLAKTRGLTMSAYIRLLIIDAVEKANK